VTSLRFQQSIRIIKNGIRAALWKWAVSFAGKIFGGTNFLRYYFMVDKNFSYIDSNKARFLDELQTFLKIPSVSADSKYKNDLLNCAKWLTNHLQGLGLEAKVVETKGHPIVRAFGKGTSGKRLLIYGHYDVQPPDPIDKWSSPPFTPTIRDGFIYARGSTDDKGQLFAHVKAVETLLKTTGKLPCDVIFLVEGEEECGGNALEGYITKEKENLACDAVVISDTSMYDEKTPAITYGLRGIVAMEIRVKTAAADLHSGVYGGAVANANTALAHIIANCIGLDGQIKIKGFYDQIRPLEEWEKKNFKKLAFDDKTLLRETGAKRTFGESDRPTLEKLWARSSLDVNGMFGGYTGEGMKTVIPHRATAKITIRLVPDQNPLIMADNVAKYVKSVCPDFADVEVVGPLSSAEPVIFDVNDKMIQAGMNALKAGFGAEPVFIRSGGSIPVVNTFWKELRKPVILMGFGLDSDGAHSTNEKFKIDNFINGIRTSTCLLAGA
jgi:acetylornithine deacetylase/succinyl-diaminopimelate desuccinylase-like protein